MDLSEIISISGKPGLYKIVGQMKSGIIVESLDDGKRFPAYASDKISTLEDISIYSYEEDVPLKEVFKKIHEKENGKAAIDPKSDNNKLKDYFEKIFPEYDQERVYVSNIRKVIQWYNILAEKDMLKFEEEQQAKGKEEEQKEEKKEAKTGKTEAKKPAKKAEKKAEAKEGEKKAAKAPAKPKKKESEKK